MPDQPAEPKASSNKAEDGEAQKENDCRGNRYLMPPPECLQIRHEVHKTFLVPHRSPPDATSSEISLTLFLPLLVTALSCTYVAHHVHTRR
jgi:hypothetical protein